jgi:uncharacterized protein (TIGR01777 family)
MKILITGATGFVGRALSLQLQQEGHELVALSRNVERARSILGDEVQIVSMADFDQGLRDMLTAVDAVINLAGEPVVGKRWSTRQKSRLRESRVGLTKRLVGLLAELPTPPATLISASAVGFYGERVDEPVEEGASAGTGFLAQLCEDWERATDKAVDLGVRVVTLRTGIVLGAGGGALPRLLPAFGLGLGGRIGDGKQAMPWIHLQDVVQIIVAALKDSKLRGAINVVSPTPVTNLEFTQSLGKALQRPTAIPVPARMLRLVMGEASTVLLGGQRAIPSKLLASGFEFQFPTLHEALADLVQNNMGCTITRACDLPKSAYLSKRRPTHELRQQTLIDAPLAEVRDFFSRAENLGLLTPPDVDFKITSSPVTEMRAGSTISYTIKLGKLPIRWRTEIESWDPEVGFVDVQMRGPYRCWWHQHRFIQRGQQTVMEDRVLYALPFGPLGRLAHRFKVSRMLIQIFTYRTRAIGFRFGRAQASKTSAPPALQLCPPTPAAATGS